MAKIFLVIAIIVSALTAALGFMTKARVDKLKNTITITQNDLTKSKAETAKTQAELKTTSENLTAANKTVEEQKTKLTGMETEVATAKADAEKAAAEVTAKQTLIADLEKKLAAVPTTGTKTVPDMEGPEMVALRAEVAKAKQELAEAQQVQDTLRTREKESAERLAEANRTVQQYRQPIDRAGLTGKVVAVNPGWNFVVLDVGDRKGATVNAPVLVTRGGQVVARLKITSVEPSTSIADVIPGTIQRGQAVQPGDRIVFAGRQAAPAAADPGPAGPAGPAAPPPANPQAQAVQ